MFFLAAKADEGEQFIVCQISVTNTGKDKKSPFPYQMYTSDIAATVSSGGDRYNNAYLNGYDSDLCGKALEPGETREGLLAFAVPAGELETGALILSFKEESKEFIFELR